MFNQFFTAEDISEPLVAVSAGEADKVKVYFEEWNYDVIGYREDGDVIGFLEKGRIADMDNLKGSVIPFRVSDLITQNTELMDCLEMLKSRPRLFVIDKSEVEAIVTFADVQKPAVRMLFFGVLTVFENLLAELISHAYPDNSWVAHLNDRRVEMTRALFSELQAKNQEINLIAYTQFADKTNILLNDAALLEEYIGQSKTKARQLLNRIRRLRDDLAHAQSLAHWFVDYDPVSMIRHLQQIIFRIEQTLQDR